MPTILRPYTWKYQTSSIFLSIQLNSLNICNIVTKPNQKNIEFSVFVRSGRQNDDFTRNNDNIGNFVLLSTEISTGKVQ